MEIGLTYKRRGIVVAAALALLLFGLGLVLTTWQNLRQQQELTDRHTLLMARTLLRGAESGVMRGLRGQDRPGLGLSPAARDFLAELFETGDLAFVAFFGDDGLPFWAVGHVDPAAGEAASKAAASRGDGLLESGEEERLAVWTPKLPDAFWESIKTEGEGKLLVAGPDGPTLVYGVGARPGLARLCMALRPDCVSAANAEPIPPPPLPGHGKGHGPKWQGMAGRGMGFGWPPPPPASPDGGPPPRPAHGLEPDRGGGPGWAPPLPFGAACPEGHRMYSLIGLRMGGHMASLNDYRRAALYQAGFVLLAGTMVLGLATAYLRRRDQGERLTRLERFRETLLDNLPDGLLTVGPDGCVVSANPAAHAILGRESGKLVGADFAELGLAPIDRGTAPGGPAGWAQTTLGGLRLETLAAPLSGGDGLAGEQLVILRDRTRQRALEEDLEEARRLAAIGGLAAGLAHEIRNPLSAIRGFAQYFLGKLKGRQPEETYAQTMVREADRLNKVVTDLLFLARPKSVEATLVTADELKADLEALLRFDLEHAGARLTGEFDRPTLWADPDALKQAVLNLILNSLAAGGRELRLITRPGQGGVWLAVRDDGRGMGAEEKERALDPFYTTRKDGAGLGLSIVQKIARDHKGRISVESVEGKGTEVALFFPDMGPNMGSEIGPKAGPDAGTKAGSEAEPDAGAVAASRLATDGEPAVGQPFQTATQAAETGQGAASTAASATASTVEDDAVRRGRSEPADPQDERKSA